MKYFLWCIVLFLSLCNITSTKAENDPENVDGSVIDEDANEYEKDNITSCLTPGREPGYCVSLLSCPHMVKAIATYKYEPVNYFKNSICGNFKVCCGIRTIFDPSRFVFGDEAVVVPNGDFQISKKLNKTAAAYRKYVKDHILPKTSYCGFQHTDDRFYNETGTALDEIPWLVNFVAYFHINKGPPKKDDVWKYCAGALITNQHVLSSSYCSIKRYIIKAVRLGQNHLRKNETCIKDSTDVECNHLVEMPVEDALVLGDSNFVLYKLQKPIIYNDYIRPICIPFKESTRPKTNGLLTTSGWSDINEDNKIGKKRIISKIVSNEDCNEGLNKSIHFGRVNPKYAVCALKEESSNSEVEQSDNGSPFTYSKRYQWFLDGVVNYVDGNYLIGEKITEDVRNWILDGLYYLYKKGQILKAEKYDINVSVN